MERRARHWRALFVWEPGSGRYPPWWAWACRAPTKVGDYQGTGCEGNQALVDTHRGGHGLAARPPGWATTRARQGFPHDAWKAMGTWCGQVGASIAAQAFTDVVIFCPGPDLFSTRCVESDGNLVWTSGCERCSAGVPERGENLSTPRLDGSGSEPIPAEWDPTPWFSTPRVESGGGLVWTSECESCGASFSTRGYFFTSAPTGARNANAPRGAGRSGSIRSGRIRR